MTVPHTADTPPEMIVGPADDDSVFWKMLPCDSSLDDVFGKYEEAAGQTLPPSFKRWYSAMYTLDADCAVVRLPENPSNHSGTGLLSYVMSDNDFWERPIALGLLPIGDEGNDGGPLCFDTNGSTEPDRWPVRFWDHDWAYKPQELGPVLFSCFDGLLAGVTAYLENVGEASQNWAGAIEALMAADPKGAGNLGRPYWEGMIDS